MIEYVSYVFQHKAKMLMIHMILLVPTMSFCSEVIVGGVDRLTTWLNKMQLPLSPEFLLDYQKISHSNFNRSFRQLLKDPTEASFKG